MLSIGELASAGKAEKAQRSSSLAMPGASANVTRKILSRSLTRTILGGKARVPTLLFRTIARALGLRSDHVRSLLLRAVLVLPLLHLAAFWLFPCPVAV